MNNRKNTLRYMHAAWMAPAVAGILLMAGTALSADTPSEIEALRSTSKAFSSVAKKVMPAVVFIQVEKTMKATRMLPGRRYYYNDPFEFFGDDFLQRFFGGQPPVPQEFRQMGQGSGFLITKDGYILTNNHVVGDADRITVKLKDGREIQAKRIGSDPKSEVAVIKIEGDNFPFIELGDSSTLDIGDWVIAVGNPFGLTETLTVGVVSAKGRSNIGIADYEDFIQTDAAINPGNSGGPLLSIDGKAVGINTAIFSQSGGYMGIGFAIPINMARAVKDQLVAKGRVTRGQLGIVIQPVTPDLAESFGMEKADGILISDVLKDSPADKAGLKQGDIVLRLNGKPVDSVGAFRNEIAMTSPGTTVSLSVFRDRATRTIKVEVGELGSEGSETAAPPAAVEEVSNKLGISVENLTADLALRLGHQSGEGVVISQVKAGGAAERAGLRPGAIITSVNRKKIASVEEFQKALSESNKTKIALLLVKEGQTSRFVAISLE